MLISTLLYLALLLKCRYKQQKDLTPLATPDQVAAILAAIASGEIIVIGTAKNQVEYAFKMRLPAFVEAVRFHLESGKKLFTKFIKTPKPDRVYFHANVGLDPDDPDEDLDVYVEIQLCNGVFVIICDAHIHIEPDPRLPK